MKDNDLIDRFVELRAKGWSFSRIAAELDVHKNTLLAWSRKHQHRIRNLRALEIESLSERFKISRETCLEALAEDVRRIREELSRRDLKDIPTARLVTLAAALRAETNCLTQPLVLSEPVPDSTPDEEFPQPTLSWQA
jgi:transposase-like protein